MRILLVTWTDQLLEKLQILNPELEYCAIVVDEVEDAKKIFERVGLPNKLFYPMYELKECVKDFYYDYIICVETNFYDSKITNKIQAHNVPKDKILSFAALNSPKNFYVENVLRYYKAHATEFEMFATGISYTEVGLDVTKFKYKLFNFGKSSQDLYYDFLIAKYAIACGGGIEKLRYALIGLAPYSFHYDLSNVFGYRYILLQYFIAFNDLHNFFVPADVYKKFIRKEYFELKFPTEPFYSEAIPRNKKMDQEARLNSREIIDGWSEKDYPETREENIKILDDYLTLCEENNIRPIMFLPPMTEGYKKHFNRQKIDEFYYLVGQACRKHSTAIFVNGWKLQGLTDADFYDVFHMNIQGAAKFSAFLNDFIESLE